MVGLPFRSTPSQDKGVAVPVAIAASAFGGR